MKTHDMAGRIAGVYQCKAQGRSYPYEAFWQESIAGVHWRAIVTYDRRVASATGDLVPAPSVDAGVAVKSSVEQWIEEFSGQGVYGNAQR